MTGERELAERVITCLQRRHWTIGLAESCSAGRLATLLTNVTGASLVVAGSLVAYQDRVKRSLLHVCSQILEQQRSVSPQCASQMAHGVQKLLGVDVAVGITGNCGPTTLDPLSSIGQVYLSILWPDGTGHRSLAIDCQFQGTREQIAAQAAHRALQALAELSHQELALEADHAH